VKQVGKTSTKEMLCYSFRSDVIIITSRFLNDQCTPLRTDTLTLLASAPDHSLIIKRAKST